MIIGYLGVQGSGKSISMTSELYKEQLKGKKIFTNMTLNFPSEMITAQQILEYTKDDNILKNCIIGIDEATFLVDSRRSISKKNIIMSALILQMRKRGNDLVYTTQNFMQVEKRLREQTDIVIFCNMCFKELNKETGEFYFKDTQKRTFNDEEIEKLYICNNINIRNEVGRFDFYEDKFIKAKPLFDLYDTTKLIHLE